MQGQRMHARRTTCTAAASVAWAPHRSMAPANGQDGHAALVVWKILHAILIIKVHCCPAKPKSLQRGALTADGSRSRARTRPELN